MRYLFTSAVFTFMLAAAVPAQAQLAATPDEIQQPVNDAPSTDEYNNIPPGLMMPKDAAAPVTDATESDDPMSINDIVAAYGEKKYDLALKHLVPLAERGHPLAEEMLGIMYRSGEGAPKDPAQAVVWLTKAAENGRPVAQHHLGIMAFLGEGEAADPVKALMWVYIAIAHYPEGPEKTRAQQDRDNILPRLSRRDKERASRLAYDWLSERGKGDLFREGRPQ